MVLGPVDEPEHQLFAEQSLYSLTLLHPRWCIFFTQVVQFVRDKMTSSHVQQAIEIQNIARVLNCPDNIKLSFWSCLFVFLSDINLIKCLKGLKYKYRCPIGENSVATCDTALCPLQGSPTSPLAETSMPGSLFVIYFLAGDYHSMQYFFRGGHKNAILDGCSTVVY